MAEFVSFNADVRGFNKFVNEVIEATGDLRLAFIQIGARKYKKIKGEVFGLTGPGQFTDLTDNPPGKGYKSRKAAKLRSAYPIFRGFTGALEKSITKNTDKNSIFRVSKTGFTMGTKVKSKKGFLYPLALQEGTKKMAKREWLFIDKNDVRDWTDIIAKSIDNRYQMEGWND